MTWYLLRCLLAFIIIYNVRLGSLIADSITLERLAKSQQRCLLNSFYVENAVAWSCYHMTLVKVSILDLYKESLNMLYANSTILHGFSQSQALSWIEEPPKQGVWLKQNLNMYSRRPHPPGHRDVGCVHMTGAKSLTKRSYIRCKLLTGNTLGMKYSAYDSILKAWCLFHGRPMPHHAQ